jgi:hypothetical protein
MVVSGRPSPAPSGTGTGGRFVLALAFVVGIGVTLYRNDVVRQAALSAGQGATYLKVEAALGGPGFGTPRAVEMAAPPASLNAAVAAAAAPMPARAPVAASQPAAAAEPARTAEREPSAPSTTAKSEPVSLTSVVAAQISAPKAGKSTRSAPAARPASRAAAAAPVSQNLGIKGSSNGYDPLNGKL